MKGKKKGVTCYGSRWAIEADCLHLHPLRYIRRPDRRRDARPSFARVYVVDKFFTADGYDYVFLKAPEPK